MLRDLSYILLGSFLCINSSIIKAKINKTFKKLAVCIQRTTEFLRHTLTQIVNTYPPNKANFSFPSTLQHKMLPLLHTFQVFEESIQEDSVNESATSIDLMLAFPLAVQVSKVPDLNNNHHI